MNSLMRDLEQVQHAANAAQGMLSTYTEDNLLNNLQRNRDERAGVTCLSAKRAWRNIADCMVLCCQHWPHTDGRCRKSQASVLAVDERQSLETLTRDEKTSSRALTQMKEKLEHFTNQKSKLQEDDAAQKLKRTEVRGYRNENAMSNELSSSRRKSLSWKLI